MRRAVAKAVAWSAASQAGRQAVQFAVGPILALLVSTGDFGLLAMASVVTNFVMSLNDVGARSALQREPRLNEPMVVGVFWLNAGLGLLCTLATAALAGPVAWLYGEPRVAGVLVAMSPAFLISSVGFTAQSVLQRRLEQRRLSSIELVSALLGATAAIVAALLGAGVYAMVLQALVGALVLTILAMASAPLPLFSRWALSDVRPVIGYSARLTAFSAINAVARNADYLLLGRFAGPDATGLYYLAYRLVVDPVSQIAAVVGRIALPVLAAVQGDEPRMRSAYLKLAGAIATATFPATLGLLAVHRELLALLGPKWAPAGVLVALLVPVGLVQAVFASAGSLYQARGRSDLLLRVGIVTSAALVLALGLGVLRGAPGVAAAYAIAMVAMAWPILAVPLGLVGLKPGAVLREVLRPLACAALMAGVVTLARPAAALLPHAAGLAALVALGLVTYPAALMLLDRPRALEMIDLARARA
jgi:O-antigen/teichoic acid export membrane protein